MKNKATILAGIKRIQEAKKGLERLPKTQRLAYIQMLDAQIRTLKWVLGHKIKIHHWCSRCRVSHINVKCPKCGNEDLFQ